MITDKLTIAMKWERDGQTYIHYIKNACITQLTTSMERDWSNSLDTKTMKRILPPVGPIKYEIELYAPGTDVYEVFTDTEKLDFDFEETVEELLKKAQKQIKKRKKE